MTPPVRIWLAAGLTVLLLHGAVLLLVRGWTAAPAPPALEGATASGPVLLTTAPVRPAGTAAPAGAASSPPPPSLPDLAPPRLNAAPTGIPLLSPHITLAAPALDLSVTQLEGPPATAALPARVYGLREVDQGPQALYRSLPPYPLAARRQHLSGRVVARLQVGADGRVQQVQILSAEPPGVFEETVRQTLLRWRFTPGRLGGEAVSVWFDQPIDFTEEGP